MVVCIKAYWIAFVYMYIYIIYVYIKIYLITSVYQ